MHSFAKLTRSRKVNENGLVNNLFGQRHPENATKSRAMQVTQASASSLLKCTSWLHNPCVVTCDWQSCYNAENIFYLFDILFATNGKNDFIAKLKERLLESLIAQPHFKMSVPCKIEGVDPLIHNKKKVRWIQSGCQVEVTNPKAFPSAGIFLF